MRIELFKSALNEFLSSQSQQLVDELKHLLQHLNFHFNAGFSRENIAAIKFEYESSSFDIVAYPVDSSYSVAGEIILLFENRQFDCFFPDNFEEEFLNQMGSIEKEKIEGQVREYKYEAFESWFAECWDAAKGNSTLKGFFSIHDTLWVTNLSDRSKIREDLIPGILTTDEQGERSTSVRAIGFDE